MKSSSAVDNLLGPRVVLSDIKLLTTERAHRSYSLTKFFMSLRSQENTEEFKSDRESYLNKFNLSEYEKNIVKSKNYTALIDYGVCQVAINKGTFALGDNLIERGAIEREMTVDSFLKHQKNIIKDSE